MDQLNQLRNDIEKLHKDLLDFVLKRKDLVHRIWQLKDDLKIDKIDFQREDFLIHQFDLRPELQKDEDLRALYHNVVKSIIAESKAYVKKTRSS